jgi:Flp pilus assembly protein TadD
LNPFNYIALADLGVWALKNQESEEAVALFSRAIRVREDYPMAHKYLGLLRAQLDEPAAAAHHLNRSLELDGNQPEAGKMRQLLAEMQQRAATEG